jgi:hypothetical protein
MTERDSINHPPQHSNHPLGTLAIAIGIEPTLCDGARISDRTTGDLFHRDAAALLLICGRQG